MIVEALFLAFGPPGRKGAKVWHPLGRADLVWFDGRKAGEIKPYSQFGSPEAEMQLESELVGLGIKFNTSIPFEPLTEWTPPAVPISTPGTSWSFIVFKDPSEPGMYYIFLTMDCHSALLILRQSFANGCIDRPRRTRAHWSLLGFQAFAWSWLIRWWSRQLERLDCFLSGLRLWRSSDYSHLLTEPLNT